MFLPLFHIFKSFIRNAIGHAKVLPSIRKKQEVFDVESAIAFKMTVCVKRKASFFFSGGRMSNKFPNRNLCPHIN